LATTLDEVKGEPVGFCYDSGHENIQRTCFKMLEQPDHQFLTVPIHDNEGWDAHALTGEENINWDKFREIFHELRYSGNFMMEPTNNDSEFKDPPVSLARVNELAERLLQKRGINE